MGTQRRRRAGKWACATDEIPHSPEYRLVVTAAAVVFRPMSECPGGPPLPPSPYSASVNPLSSIIGILVPGYSQRSHADGALALGARADRVAAAKGTRVALAEISTITHGKTVKSTKGGRETFALLSQVQLIKFGKGFAPQNRLNLPADIEAGELDKLIIAGRALERKPQMGIHNKGVVTVTRGRPGRAARGNDELTPCAVNRVPFVTARPSSSAQTIASLIPPTRCMLKERNRSSVFRLFRMNRFIFMEPLRERQAYNISDEKGNDGGHGGRRENRPPELLLTGRSATAEAATSRQYSVLQPN
ncbi:hypothetical protein EVAR_63283_1 [Eumeta japonica]|uniref:Uncharacterized protein n=1 Tax=Eumeta variegata TaxID=151549 RepID=A0A4C2A1Q4_EUMVA|nr:hypothetical protein EVAR_63283_1 [Eumeta japonica]